MTFFRPMILAGLVLGAACGTSHPDSAATQDDLFVLDASEQTRSELGIATWGITMGQGGATLVHGYDGAGARTMTLQYETHTVPRPTLTVGLREKNASATMTLQSGSEPSRANVTDNSFANDLGARRALARIVADLETQQARPTRIEAGTQSAKLGISASAKAPSNVHANGTALVQSPQCLLSECRSALIQSASKGSSAAAACQSTEAQGTCATNVASVQTTQAKASDSCGSCAAPSCGAASTSFAGTSWTEADALFRKDSRWLGGDVASTIALGGDKTLWLFGDSYVNKDAGQSRQSMIRNTIAVQQGTDPLKASISFGWQTKNGAPSAMFPNEGSVGFWPAHGARQGTGGPVFVFLTSVAQSGDNSLGFTQTGYRIARLDNTDGAASDMKVTLLPEPAATSFLMGFSAIAQDDYLVAFGRSKDPSGFQFPGYVARYKWSDLLAGSVAPEFWNGSGWGAAGGARAVMDDFGVEGSVHKDSSSGQWIHVANEGGIGPLHVYVRTASELTGPWSAAADSFVPPESQNSDADTLVYAGKAHPELSAPSCGEVVVTYVVNSKNLATVGSSKDLYYPRFVRLQRR